MKNFESFKLIPLFQLFQLEKRRNYFKLFSFFNSTYRNELGQKALIDLNTTDGTYLYNGYVNNFGTCIYSITDDFKANFNNPFIHDKKQFFKLLETECFCEKLYEEINRLNLDDSVKFFNSIMDLALFTRSIYLLDTLYYSNDELDRLGFKFADFIENLNELKDGTITSKYFFSQKKNYYLNAIKCITSNDDKLFKKRLNYLKKLNSNVLKLLGAIFNKYVSKMSFNSINHRNKTLKNLFFYCYSFILVDNTEKVTTTAFNRRNSDFFRMYAFKPQKLEK